MENKYKEKNQDLKNIGILLLVNLIITTLIFVMHQNSIGISKIKLFSIDWIFSNSIGFTIFILLNSLETLRLSRRNKVILALIAIVLGSFVGGYLGSVINSVLFGFRMAFLKSDSIKLFLSISVIFGSSAYTLFILLGRIHTKKIEWLKEKEARTNAELTSLRTRINPHFLFNTLNSISGLIHTEPDSADAMLQQLSELLRYTLYAAEIPMIELAKELEAVEQYLQIETIRFGERMSYTINNSVSNFKLPPLLLLTLVENAIKHGVAPSLEGGKVEILAEKQNSDLVISVANSGIAYKENSEYGFGLEALTKLLEINYQDLAEFTIENDNGFTVAKLIFKGLM